jgi:hypothetical protein
MKDKKENTMVSVRLDNDLLVKVKLIANKEEISVSDLLRHFIVRGCTSISDRKGRCR